MHGPHMIFYFETAHKVDVYSSNIFIHLPAKGKKIGELGFLKIKGELGLREELGKMGRKRKKKSISTITKDF